MRESLITFHSYQWVTLKCNKDILCGTQYYYYIVASYKQLNNTLKTLLCFLFAIMVKQIRHRVALYFSLMLCSFVSPATQRHPSLVAQLCFCTIRVHTHQQSRVESNPVQTQKDEAVTLWLTYNGSRSNTYTPAEPSQSRVTRVLPIQESWCCMLHFRQSDSSDRGWRLQSWGRNGCGKAYSFS